MANACRVYVGGLRPDTTERELEDEFNRYGQIRSIWVARKPPGFAFIEFEDTRDAEDACRKIDGTRGWRVELSRRPPGGGGGRRDDRGGYDDYRGPPRGRGELRCYECNEIGHMARDCPRRRRSPPRRRSCSPRRRSRSPARRDESPRRRREDSRSPVRRRASPPESPRGRRASPPESPRGRRASPPESPRGRRDDSRGRSPPRDTNGRASPARSASPDRNRSRGRSGSP